jgi:23S rRNA pseudouridine1911/1915/1917 synthase
MHSTKDNLEVLFEDNHLLIVNKKSGDIVQGDKTGDKPLSDVVKEYIKEKYNKPGEVFLGVVHRLDRPTSGIIIFARTSKALERLNKMLRERTISKTYWAVVKNTPLKEKDSLIHFLKKNPKNNKSTVFTKETDASKKAILHYSVIKKLDNYSLLEIDLETGRHHQIRAQLAYIGSPIKGDLKYGASRSNKDGSIHLHARKILFTHPVSKENISILAPIPNEVIWNVCL